MRIESGAVNKYLHFVAVDATDLKTRKTGLTGFTVYRSRNGGVSTAMTTPTVAEVDATNMPGVYNLLLDEDTTIAAGNDSEEMALHISQTSMAPVTRVVELYRPKITQGNTLDVTATGAAGIDWGNVENPTTTVDLSATSLNLCDTVTTLTGHTAQTGDVFAALPTNFADLAITVTTGQVTVGTNNDKTGYALTQAFPTNFADMSITATTGRVDVAAIAGTAQTANDNGADINAILADTNELQTDDVPGLIAALNNISVADILTTQMTESYAADGVPPTLTQAVMLIQQLLAEKAINSTTQTVKKLDGTTTAATFTLDSATAPTSITRST